MCCGAAYIWGFSGAAMLVRSGVTGRVNRNPSKLGFGAVSETKVAEKKVPAAAGARKALHPHVHSRRV